MPGGSIGRALKRMKRESDAPTVILTGRKAGNTRAYKYRRFRRGYDRTGGYYGRFNKYGDAPRASEQKFFDTTLSFAFDATGEVPATGQLCLIPQGVTESTRVGRKCLLKSIYIKGSLAYSPTTSAAAASTSYLYLILDKQTNGAAAGASDVFMGTSFQTALRNLSNSSRFRILKMWVMDFNSTAGVSTAYNSVRKHIDYYRKLNIPLEFSSTMGALTEIRSNNLFLMAGMTGADDLISMDGVCRLRFTDQ